MSETEIVQMLHTIGCAQPEAFVKEARSRGLDDLLGSPQTLQMLNAAVQSKSWPTSRRERLYFSLFSDTEAKSTSAARLTQFLGAARVPTALQGLRALVERGEISSLEEIIAMCRHERYWEWWYAVVAGLTEIFDAQGHLDNVLPTYLQSAVAIDLLYPTWRENRTRTARHPWVEWVATRYPQHVWQAYLTLTQFDLDRGAEFVHGFNELMHMEQLAPLRATGVCDLLLQHGQSMKPHYLIDAFGDDDIECDRRHWEVSRLISSVIERLATDTSDEARAALIRCSVDPRSASFHDELKHGIAQQTVHRVDAAYHRPNWNEAVAVLRNGPPVSMADLHALVHAHLDAIRSEVKYLNTDLFKDFWNEDSYGRVTDPKPENSCRNVLIELLKPRLGPLGIRVQPEGHMANAKRGDVEITVGTTMKLVIELRRHYHDEIWTAAHEQLDRFYSNDPQSQGYGIYDVIWFGAHVAPMPRPPNDQDRPTSARQVAQMIATTIPAQRRPKITSWVLDVSNEPD